MSQTERSRGEELGWKLRCLDNMPWLVLKALKLPN